MLLAILPSKVLKSSTTKNNKKDMALSIIQEVTSAGGTFNFDASSWSDNTTLSITCPSTTSLAANAVVDITTPPPIGAKVFVQITFGAGNMALNGNTLTVLGQSLPQWLCDTSFYMVLTMIESGLPTIYYVIDQFVGGVNGTTLLDGSIPIAKLEALTSGQIIVGSGANEPTAVAVTGDVTISNAGVTAIGSGVIVNADVNASAAIDRSKLASGTASHVVINSGAGAFSSEAQLLPVRGGTGVDASAATGFLRFASGTGSVSAIPELQGIAVSFEAGELGDYKIKIPFACTLTEIYGYATKVIAGTDAGTIVAKNNAGTTMAGSTMTFAISDPRGSAYTVTPTTNNTFVAGDILTLTTAKTTAGGKVQLSLTFTRTT